MGRYEKMKKFVYKPAKGFIDLTEKPKTLTKKEHRKIQELQTFIIKQNERLEIIKQDKHNFYILQDMSAYLNLIIYEHWGIGNEKIKKLK